MDILSAIITRRSVRVFQNKKIEKEKIEKIIELATHAPSACNVQGWRFIIVDDEKIKQEIIDEGGSVVIKNAPVGILVLYDNRTKEKQYHDYIQSASAAIQNIHLSAPEFGLSTCWICHLPSPKKLRKILKIPKQLSPIAYVLIGYKNIEPINIPRKYQTSDLIGYNKYPSQIPIEKINKINLIIKILLIKIYNIIPKSIKKIFLNKYIDKKFVKKFKN